MRLRSVIAGKIPVASDTDVL